MTSAKECNFINPYRLQISFLIKVWQSLPNAFSVWTKNPLCVTIAISFSFRVHNLYREQKKLSRTSLKFLWLVKKEHQVLTKKFLANQPKGLSAFTSSSLFGSNCLLKACLLRDEMEMEQDIDVLMKDGLKIYVKESSCFFFPYFFFFWTSREHIRKEAQVQNSQAIGAGEDASPTPHPT